MAKVISFANQKGGVGKTTSAVNIASAMGISGKKTLLLDFDPQGNATSAVGVKKSKAKYTTYDIVIGNASADQAIIQTEFKNLWVLPSNMPLAAAEIELVDVEKREFALKNAIKAVEDRFDYIVIDCPPSLGMLTVNALTASDGVVVPMQCEYFALEGLSQILMTIKRVKELYNPSLSFTGIIITMFNGRLNLSAQVLDELKKHYADKLFSTTVTRNVRLGEAPSYGLPIQYFDKYAKGSEDYNTIAKELMRRI